MADDGLVDDRPDAGLSRTFAVIAAELEDAATELTAKHTRLAKELDAVDSELRRIEAVRSAMNGGGRAKPKRAAATASAARPSTDKTAAAERIELLTEYAKTHAEGFRGGDAAEATGLHRQGVGPILTAMTRKGIIDKYDDPEQGVMYRLAAS